MKTYLKVLPLIFCNAISFSNNVLENSVVLNDTSLPHRFVHIGIQASELKSVTLVFKSMPDCRGSDLERVQLDSYAGIPLVQGQEIGIRLNDTYKAHSVLMHFLNRNGSSASFVKGCRLKGDNEICCENIHCHPSEPNCRFNPINELQLFFFAK